MKASDILQHTSICYEDVCKQIRFETGFFLLEIPTKMASGKHRSPDPGNYIFPKKRGQEKLNWPPICDAIDSLDLLNHLSFISFMSTQELPAGGLDKPLFESMGSGSGREEFPSTRQQGKSTWAKLFIYLRGYHLRLSSDNTAPLGVHGSGQACRSSIINKAIYGEILKCPLRDRK